MTLYFTTASAEICCFKIIFRPKEIFSTSIYTTAKAMVAAPETLPRRHQRSGSSAIEPTNTLIIANLPDELFEHSLNLMLRRHFAVYGRLAVWVPLKGFGRIMAVFFNLEQATRAKYALDKSVIQDSQQSNIPDLRIHPIPT